MVNGPSSPVDPAMPEPKHHDPAHPPKWKFDGVRVIPGHALDPNTAQTPGMDRKAAINAARVGARKISAGRSTSIPTQRRAPITMVHSRA